MRIIFSPRHAASAFAADAGRAFHQDRLLDALGEIDRGRDLLAGDIAGRGESTSDGLDRIRRQNIVHYCFSLPIEFPSLICRTFRGSRATVAIISNAASARAIASS